MKQVFDKGAKIQVVETEKGNWYKIGEIYTVHSYLEHKNAYVVEEDYEVYKDSAWVEAKDVEMYIDWSKAPEGYDFWIVPSEGSQFPPDFHKLIGDRYYDINGEYYEEYYCDDVAVYKRPVAEKKEVNNEWKHGLPPVNTEFEYSFGGNYWFKATCTYVVADSGVVAMCDVMGVTIEQYLYNEECEFRPVKSKEEQEKESTIVTMVEAANPTGTFHDVASLFCERLYDAGWRKVE